MKTLLKQKLLINLITNIHVTISVFYKRIKGLKIGTLDYIESINKLITLEYRELKLIKLYCKYDGGVSC